jgi:N-acetylglucosamine kinase-like BadF-type ATPase
MPDAVVVGVDAGGSHTTAIAACGAATPRTFSGGPANAALLGSERAAESIAAAVEQVLAGERAAAVYVGAAGAWQAETAASLREALERRMPGARVAVSDDAHIALRAAVASGDGLALICGTGSIGYAEIAGERFRTGGYGYALGDEGSGYAIGSAALKLLLRSYDGRAPGDPMLSAIAERIGATCAADVVARVYRSEAPPATVAAVAPLVLEWANANERSATKIVQTAALDLFELVRALARKAGVRPETPLVFAGGLLRENSVLTYLLETRIGSDLPDLRILKGAPEAHFGALHEARVMLASA